MNSDTKLFQKKAKYIEEKNSFDFQAAKREVLKEFNEWREKEKPTILAINFGRKHSTYITDGTYITENPSYWYVEALYLFC